MLGRDVDLEAARCERDRALNLFAPTLTEARVGDQSARRSVVDQERVVLREHAVERAMHERQHLDRRELRQRRHQCRVLLLRSLAIDGADPHVRVDGPRHLVAAAAFTDGMSFLRSSPRG